MGQQIVNAGDQNSSWVSSQPSNAAATSSGVDVGEYKVFWIQVSISGSSSPAGNVVVQGCLDDSSYQDLYLDANKVYGTTGGSDYSHAGGVSIPYTGSSDSVFLIALENPPKFVRVSVARASGGTTGNRVNAQWFGRPV